MEHNRFVDVLTIHNDQISHVQPIYPLCYVVLSLFFGCLHGGQGLLSDFVTNRLVD